MDIQQQMNDIHFLWKQKKMDVIIFGSKKFGTDCTYRDKTNIILDSIPVFLDEEIMLIYAFKALEQIL